MKKILFSMALLASSASIAQIDTLSEFFTGTPTIYTAGVNQTTGASNGFVSGNNVFGDKQKMMKFDPVTGWTASGSLTKVLFWVAAKADGGGSVDVNVYTFVNDSTLGTLLGTTTVTLASIDTAAASLMNAGGVASYNAVATFATPVNLPVDGKFVVGVSLPTGQNAIVIYTNEIGDFTNALTNTFEVWSDDTFTSMATAWGTTAAPFTTALAIYPVVDLSTAGTVKLELSATVYPNPASGVLNISVPEEMTSYRILSQDGKVVAQNTISGFSSQINISELVEGLFILEVATANGKIARNTFVKK